MGKGRKGIINIDAWGDNMVTCLPAIMDMEKFIQSINNEYPIKVNRIKRIDDKKCEAYTKDGAVVIERIVDCGARAAFLNGLYGYMKDKGFTGIIEIYASMQGSYFTDIGGEFYAVYPSGWSSMRSMEGFEEIIIRTAARFHRYSEGYIPPIGSKHKSGWGKCIDKYKDGLKDIKKYKDSTRAKNTRSPFETLFLRNCDKFMDMTEEALSLLTNKGYLDVVEDSMKRRQICLYNLKPSSWVSFGSNIYIRSLNKCRYDIPENDIALFFRETIKSRSWIYQERVKNFIYIYNRENNLNRCSIDIIKALLLYPDNYAKVCQDYFKEGPAKTDSIYINKLHEAEAFEKEKYKLVEMLDYIN